MHLLLSLGTTVAPADLVRELTKASSVWAAQEHDPLFAWQEGYAIFTVSWTHVVAVRRYIAGQEEHHRQTGFVDELKRVWERNGVEYDPRYLVCNCSRSRCPCGRRSSRPRLSAAARSGPADRTCLGVPRAGSVR